MFPSQVRVYQCAAAEAGESREDERPTCESCEKPIDDGERSDNDHFTLHIACDDQRRAQQASDEANYRAWRRS